MPVAEFVDSNIWLYALLTPDARLPDARQQRARQFIDRLQRPVINSQVVREVCVNLLKKSALDEPGLQRWISEWYPACKLHPDSEAQHLLASQLRQSLALSFWDSLIVAAALDAGCTTLYSEDMQHGQRIEGRLSIVNPLLATPA